MKIKLNHIITDLYGIPIGGGRSGALTIGDAAVHALTMNNRDDPAAKIRKYALAKKLIGVDEVDLPVEEVATIKAAISGEFPGVVAGGAEDAIEAMGNPPEVAS